MLCLLKVKVVGNFFFVKVKVWWFLWRPSKREFQLSSSSLPGVPAPSPSQAAETVWCLGEGGVSYYYSPNVTRYRKLTEILFLKVYQARPTRRPCLQIKLMKE